MNRKLPPVIAFLSFVGLWQAADLIMGIEKIILPNPVEIAGALVEHTTDIAWATAITMTEAVLGFLLASVVAYCAAILFVYSPGAKDAFYPYAIALKSTPLIALAPLLVFWFGNGMLSKIVMAALVAFFPVLVTSVQGLMSIDKELIDLLRSMSASPGKIFLKVRIPGSLPYLFASLRVASSLAVVGAVIGEFTGSSMGIGFLLNTASYYLETPLLFAGVVAISLSGIAFFFAVAWVERVVVFWHPTSSGADLRG